MVGGGVEMCEIVGVGVRVFARWEAGTCEDGGGVIWLVAFSTRFACTLDIAAAALSGIVACGGLGVAGSLTSGAGIRLDKLSCDS